MKSTLKFKQTRSESKFILTLQGSVDENFETLVAPDFPSDVHYEVICDEVISINSSGIKAWVKFFSELRVRGHQIRFYQLTPALIQIASLGIPLTNDGEVISMQVPMYCSRCHAHSHFTHQVSDGALNLARLKDSVSCYGCGGTLNVDDIFEDYLKLQLNNSLIMTEPHDETEVFRSAA